jgi:hypothetical protein
VLAFACKSYASAGRLTIWEDGGRTRWTMEETADPDTRGVLRQGELDNPAFIAICDELRTAWARERSSAMAGEYSIELALFQGESCISRRRVQSDTTKELNRLLPDAPVFGPMWRDATGIPKMYWYRELGPIDWSTRQVMPVPSSPPADGGP